MATGRMLQKKIGLDKAVHDLSSDTCRLAFTWTIPHLDKNGCIHGDPAALKSLVFPRRDDLSAVDIERFVKEWVRQGLVIWYEADGDKWLHFPAFTENQPGLRKDREPDSGIPLPEDCRILAGNMPEDCPPNGKERKGNKSKGNSSIAPKRSNPTNNNKDPRIKRLIDYFHNAYVAKTKEKPTVTGQWGRNLKVLLRAHTEETVQRVIDAFFAYKKRTRFSFSDFMRTFDNILPIATGSRASPKKMEPDPPKTCPNGHQYLTNFCPDCGWSETDEEYHGSV